MDDIIKIRVHMRRRQQEDYMHYRRALQLEAWVLRMWVKADIWYDTEDMYDRMDSLLPVAHRIVVVVG